MFAFCARESQWSAPSAALRFFCQSHMTRRVAHAQEYPIVFIYPAENFRAITCLVPVGVSVGSPRCNELLSATLKCCWSCP